MVEHWENVIHHEEEVAFEIDKRKREVRMSLECAMRLNLMFYLVLLECESGVGSGFGVELGYCNAIVLPVSGIETSKPC